MLFLFKLKKKLHLSGHYNFSIKFETYFYKQKYTPPCLSFFSWPLCCLFFFDIRILITPLVSLNSSLNSNHILSSTKESNKCSQFRNFISFNPRTTHQTSQSQAIQVWTHLRPRGPLHTSLDLLTALFKSWA
jgi:hypothetical protein